MVALQQSQCPFCINSVKVIDILKFDTIVTENLSLLLTIMQGYTLKTITFDY